MRNRHLMVACLMLALGLGACGVARVVTPSGAEVTAVPFEATWTRGAQMPTARSEMPAVLLQDRIYVPGGFGGPSALEAYDPVEDAWHTLAELPEPRHHLMSAAFDGELFVMGGARNLTWQATNSVWLYDPRADVWNERAPMPETRLAAAAVSIGERIYIVGGTGGSEGLLVYTPTEDSWRARPGPQARREHLAAVEHEGELWVIGGRWGGAGERSRVEIFDPADESWRAGPELIQPRGGFAAAAGEGRILAAGGEKLTGERGVISSVEGLGSDGGAWQLVSDLPAPVHGMGMVFFDGRWLVIGGSDRAGGIANEGLVQILSLR